MRNLLRFLMIVLFAVAQLACEGPEGPAGKDGEDGLPGPQGASGPVGPTGPAGPSSKARVIENNFSFNKANNFTSGINFAQNNITVGDKDVVMCYVLFDVERDASGNPVLTNGQQTPIWMPMPRTFNFTNIGAVNFDYAHSKNVVFIFLDAEQATLDKLPATFARPCRVVVIPGSTTGARMANGAKAPSPVDLNNYEAVVKYYQIDEKDVIKIK